MLCVAPQCFDDVALRAMVGPRAQPTLDSDRSLDAAQRNPGSVPPTSRITLRCIQATILRRDGLFSVLKTCEERCNLCVILKGIKGTL